MFVFAGKGCMDHYFIKMGYPSDCGVFSLEEDKRVCTKHEGCIIPLYEYFFP